MGFLCCVLIACGYFVIDTTFNEAIYSAREIANNDIGVTLVAILGGAIGAVVTLILYLIGFTGLRTVKLVWWFSLIALATTTLGLCGAFFGPNIALFMTVVGFMGHLPQYMLMLRITNERAVANGRDLTTH